MPFDVLIYENSSLHLQGNVNHIRLQNRQDSVPTCFAEGRAVVAEAILRNISKKYRGSSRRQCFSGSIRGSCGCLHGSYAEGFEVRLYLQQVLGSIYVLRLSHAWLLFFCDAARTNILLSVSKNTFTCPLFFRRKMQAPRQAGSQCPCRIVRCCWWTTALTTGKACTVEKNTR